MSPLSILICMCIKLWFNDANKRQYSDISLSAECTLTSYNSRWRRLLSNSTRDEWQMTCFFVVLRSHCRERERVRETLGVWQLAELIHSRLIVTTISCYCVPHSADNRLLAADIISHIVLDTHYSALSLSLSVTAAAVSLQQFSTRFYSFHSPKVTHSFRLVSFPKRQPTLI